MILFSSSILFLYGMRAISIMLCFLDPSLKIFVLFPLLSTTMATPSSNVPHCSRGVLISINASQLPLQLTRHNYLMCRAQIVPVFHGYNLIGYVTRTLVSPPDKIQTDGNEVDNLDYEFWYCQDHLVLAYSCFSDQFYCKQVCQESSISSGKTISCTKGEGRINLFLIIFSLSQQLPMTLPLWQSNFGG